MPTKIIAFQGRPGAYSESAALRLYGPNIDVLPLPYFEDVFCSVKDGTADAGVLPVENSTMGSILENYDYLLDFSLPITGEVKLKINHLLLGRKEASIDCLKRVMSHPQALGQCSHFFRDHKKIEAIPTFDTAGSAEKVSHSADNSLAAIAGYLAAKEYGLEILASDIVNQTDGNFTRFLSVESKAFDLKDNENCKTTLVFAPPQNRVGTLYEALGIFANKGLDLLKIESRPKPGSPFQYLFILDFKGSIQTDAGKEALFELEKLAKWVRVLGCYPQGKKFDPLQSR